MQIVKLLSWKPPDLLKKMASDLLLNITALQMGRFGDNNIALNLQHLLGF